MKKIVWMMLVILLVGCQIVGCQKVEEPERNTVKTNVRKEEFHPVFIAEGIRKVELQKNKTTLLEVAYAPKEGEQSYEHWKIGIPYDQKGFVNTEALLKFFHTLEAIEFEPAIEVEEEIKKQLDQSLVEIEIWYCQTVKEERQAVLSEKSFADSPSYYAIPDSQSSILIGPKTKEGGYYSQVKGSEKVFILSEKIMEDVFENPAFSLILKVPAVPAVDKIRKMKIQIKGKEHIIEAKALTREDGRLFYTKLWESYLVKDVEGEAKKELLCTINIQVEGEEREKIFSYYQSDETNVILEIDGKAYWIVKRNEVENMMNHIEAYIAGER